MDQTSESPPNMTLSFPYKYLDLCTASLSFVEQLALSVTPGSKSWLEKETTDQSLDGFSWAWSLQALFFNLFIQFPVGVCNFNQ
jgi:hypothetical protein